SWEASDRESASHRAVEVEAEIADDDGVPRSPQTVVRGDGEAERVRIDRFDRDRGVGARQRVVDVQFVDAVQVRCERGVGALSRQTQRERGKTPTPEAECARGHGRSLQVGQWAMEGLRFGWGWRENRLPKRLENSFIHLLQPSHLSGSGSPGSTE